MEIICSKVNQTIEVKMGEGWNAVAFYKKVFMAKECRGSYFPTDDGDLLSVEISIGTVFYCIKEVPQPEFRGSVAVKTNNVEEVMIKAGAAGATEGLIIQGDCYIKDPFGIQWVILKGEEAGVNGAVLALERQQGGAEVLLVEGARTGVTTLRLHAKGAGGAGDGAGASKN